MIQSISAAHAKAYFSQSLDKSDYYIDDQELNGKIQGRLAERLGITGPATKESFFALSENVNPATGEQLTARQREERTVGYDINFHCPKSVSILHALSKDDHLLELFHDSVKETMKDIERDSKTRVRKKGAYDDRETGELVWADFVHQTARPVDGSVPDPHLHAHCFVFNATWDEQEERIKAGQFRDINRDMPYYQARFHKRLSDNLIKEGYEIRRAGKSFEVTGVPKNVIALFSKRTDEIGRIAKEKGITDIDELGALGARTRSKKQKGLSMSELKTEWKRQIKELEPDKDDDGNSAVRFSTEKQKDKLSPELCVDHAMLHGFERASVMHDRRLLDAAYRHSIGDSSISLEDVTSHFQQDDRIIHVKDKFRTMCTTRQVLSEEQKMVKLAREGQGKLKPLYSQVPELFLNGQQAEAVRHVLTTPHRVSIIRGAAGTGKTTLMKEAASLMKKAGKQVIVVAPTAQASRGVLREEGFDKAETVATLLQNKKMQDKLKDQVLWVDEAGLLGTKDMTSLLELVTKQNARLILGGDTRQHSSVIRGDALRILNTVGGIKTAEVSKIYRQKNFEFRSVVEDLSKGNVKDGFEKLDQIQSIQNIDPLKPNDLIVGDYIEAVKKGKSALVIAPTHQQGDEVTDEIRKKLKSAGLVGKKEISASRFKNLNLTEAEKADWRNFQPGQVVQFNQNVPGIKRGSLWNVTTTSNKAVMISNDDNQLIPLPVEKSSQFEVYSKSEIGISKGDIIRITRNGFDEKDSRLNNGQILEVVGVKKKGDIMLRNKFSKESYQLKKDYGHIAHAHCITSHASQGKTVDEVFISQPAATFPATDAKQFYVSVSRARERARIYTDDKEQLLHHASQMGDRMSAIELVSKRNKSEEMAQQHIRDEMSRSPALPEKPKNIDKSSPTRHQDYEPGI
ncbi:conjugative relaxase [Dyadobacter frigoris]|uniref:Conjugative relaxase n=2 Tax=Dyadobacter frigoris TaxID=2576211 RepID=A0A4U6DAY4_9BACT|nr:conjugative relaxase [Dyadobacter frigoris]